jgi:hypothetical protein
MEICGIKEGDFDFKAKKTSDDEDTKLALVHFPSQEVLPRDAINVEYTNGSDSAHSLNDEKESKSLLINKTMIKIVQLDDLDTKLKFGSKVKLSTRGGFKELDVPNLSKSLSQIEKVMDQSKLKRGKRNAYYPIFGISPRKTRRCELLKLVSQQRSQGKRVECTLLQIKDFIVKPNFDLLFTNLCPFMYDLAITKI